MKYAAVIVETRCTENIGQIIFDHMSKLPESFSLYVFYGNSNKAFLKKELKDFDSKMKLKFGKNFVCDHDLHLINIESNDFFVKDQHTYNALLTSEWFWDHIIADQVLIFQPDSNILNPDRNCIMNYLDYNYVGAPWPFQSHGGNGGLSWRTVWYMKKIVRDYPYLPSYGNEDVYFCNIMHENNYGLAPEQVCRTFSVESKFQLGTFGCHDIEQYLTKEECDQIYNQ
jgi:hypothetical protein